MTFLDADVKRPLGAAAAMVDAGNTVVFSRKGSYIENDDTGERIPLVRKRGVFVMKIKVDEMDVDEAEKEIIKKRGMDMEVDEVDDDDDDLVFAMTKEEVADFIRRA